MAATNALGPVSGVVVADADCPVPPSPPVPAVVTPATVAVTPAVTVAAPGVFAGLKREDDAVGVGRRATAVCAACCRLSLCGAAPLPPQLRAMPDNAVSSTIGAATEKL
ncbi:MAG: hypothetical protein HY682_07020 [Chloroflexi bacterium]|nr:hypothetical protein [Chloroflexota bacterium]